MAGYTPAGRARTHVSWTYAFALKPTEFPGYLGALGRYFFHIGFLDRQYAALMRATLKQTKANAENFTPN